MGPDASFADRILRIARTTFHAALVFTLLGATVALAEDAKAAGSSITGDVTAHTPKQRAGVVVYLDKVAGSYRPPARPVQMDQKGMSFVPHVLAVLKGTTVKFQNSDAVRHNVFSPDNEKYDLGSWGQGESKTHTFATPGVYHQLCNVHPEMGAVIFVAENPYFAVTGADGKFEIAGVPPGTYTLKAWSEKSGESSQQVTVAATGASNVHVKVGK